MSVLGSRVVLASVMAVLLGGGVGLGPVPAVAWSPPRPEPSLSTTFEWRSSGPLVAPQADADHPVVSVKDPTVVWRSSGPLGGPQADADQPVVSVKDPTVVRYRDRWYVYATTANTSGNWSLVHFNFTDWSKAGAAPQYHMDRNPAIGSGYRAA